MSDEPKIEQEVVVNQADDQPADDQPADDHDAEQEQEQAARADDE